MLLDLHLHQRLGEHPDALLEEVRVALHLRLAQQLRSPILSSSAIVISPSVAWSLPKEPHGGRPRQRPLLLHTYADTVGLFISDAAYSKNVVPKNPLPLENTAMSMHPQPIGPVPEDTARVARAAFPKGNVYIEMRNVLGTIYEDEDFAELFEVRGRPAIAPWRLALVTVMQFSEGLSDRQAAEAVRARIDWKYALGLKLSDPGFNFSVLSEFRSRLLEGGKERLLLEKLLEGCKERGYLKVRGRQRTDSTHVLGALRVLSKWERTAETMRSALNALASAEPEWLTEHADPEWFERYGRRIEDQRLPKGKEAREQYLKTVGADGMRLLEQLDAPHAPQVSQRACRGRDTAPNLGAVLRENRWRDTGSRPKRDA